MRGWPFHQFQNQGRLVSPGQISGLALWLRADAGLILDGSNNVSDWNDQSGNARHLTQATATARPSGTAATLNGRPVVRFDGADDSLTRAAQDLAAGWGITNQFTLAAVRRCNTGPGTLRGFVFWPGASSTNEFTVWDAFNDDNVYFDCGPIAGGGRVNFLADPGTGWRRTVARRQSGGGFGAWREGVSIGTGSYSANLSTSSATFTMGEVGGGFGAQDVAEFCLWNRALSDLERGQVDAWLRSRWGI